MADGDDTALAPSIHIARDRQDGLHHLTTPDWYVLFAINHQSRAQLLKRITRPPPDTA